MADLIIGKNERIVIHAGLALGRVNKLSGNFIADGTIIYDFADSSEVPTNGKFEFGHFFGFNYNFSNPDSDKK